MIVKMMSLVSVSLATGLLCAVGHGAVPLPGEPATRPALAPDPFPDRMSAYVWRNWFCVPKERLASVVGATAEDIEAIAREMGLPPQPPILPEWRRKGYITVVRRNWHLLDYDQLLKTIDMDREEFRFRLKEDDFLWSKLGKVKPKCGPLRWSEEMRDQGSGIRDRGRRDRAWIAETLREYGLDDFSEEPRFTFIKDISAVTPHPQSLIPNPQSPIPNPQSPIPNLSSPFDFRLIFSYFADYADPLADPEIGSFPEGLLQKLAAQGVNAVWMHTVLGTLAKDPKYPEFGEGSEARIEHLSKLVARCAKYGIKVYLYMNEPRSMPAEFFEKPGREGLRGVRAHDGTGYALCTSVPEVRRWVRDSLRDVFSQVKGLGGIFTITMSENLTHCDSHGKKGDCPRCRGRRTCDLIAEVNRAMIEGMQAGDPDATALVWNWQWPKDEEEAIVAALPKRNVRVMAVSENAMPVRRGGGEVSVSDYSISVVGPGENALKLWNAAGRNGLGAVAKVQANCSWELSPFPYLPVMDLVAEHAHNLARTGVDGIMLSWSVGCCPAPNLSVFRDYRKGDTGPGDVLNRLASALYGDKAAQARRAWTAFSDGFREYPFHIVTLYFGPQHMGPANPLYLRPTGYAPTMVGFPYDGLDGDGCPGDGAAKWRASYPAETWMSQMEKVAAGFRRGCELMKGVASERELGLFRAETMHFEACADQAAFVRARKRGDRAEMIRRAQAELERARAYLPLVRADSRIGYESSCQYFFIPQDIREKVLCCAQIIRGLKSADGLSGKEEVVLRAKPDKGHLQDVWYDGKDCLYWAHTRELYKTDLDGNVLRRVDVEGHHAGLATKDGRLYVAVCPMQNTTGGKTTPECRVTIGEYDAETLALVEMHRTDIHDRSGSLAILEDGTFLVGCLRPQDIAPTQVRFHHLDRNYRLIKSYVLDDVPVRLGIEVIKRRGDRFYLCMYGNDAKGIPLAFDTIVLGPDIREERRMKTGASFGLVFGSDSVWSAATVSNGAGGYESRIVRKVKPLVVAERGKEPAYTIVLPKDASPSQKTAADELQKYICEMTGVRLPIGEKPVGWGGIFLGNGTEDLGDDGFRIVAYPPHVWILGGKVHGTLFGVYDFLERYCGCEWLSPTTSVVPKRDRVTVPGLVEDRQVPAFELRDANWTDHLADLDFTAKLKLNGFRIEYPERLGGRNHRKDTTTGGATFDSLCPAAKYFKDHPDWFSMVDGRRRGDMAQRCLTNPGFLDFITSNVLARIRKNYPQCKYYAVYQNDWSYACACPSCRAIDEAEGTPMGTMLAMANHVAERVSKEYPDVTILTFSYSYTLQPPKTLRPHKNVMICYCTDKCDFSKPLQTSRWDENRKFCERFKVWREKTDNLYIWDYSANFHYLIMPFECVHVFQDNFRFYRDIGVKGVFEEGDHYRWKGTDEPLKTWMLAHLLWNPDQPVEPLLDRFFKGYYGAAAPVARGYYDALVRIERNRDELELPLKMTGDTRYLYDPNIPPAFMDEWSRKWTAALELVKDDPVRRDNVYWARYNVDLVRLVRSDCAALLNLSRRGKALAKELAELQPIARRTLADFKRYEKNRLGHFCTETDNHLKRIERIANADASVFEKADGRAIAEASLLRPWKPDKASPVDDPKAREGKAIRIDGKSPSWQHQCVNFQEAQVTKDPGMKIRIRVHVRVEKTGFDKGYAFAVGTCRNVDYKKRDIRQYDIPIGEVPDDGEYHWYDAKGVWQPIGGEVVFVTNGYYPKEKESEGNPCVKAIYVDAIELVRAE